MKHLFVCATLIVGCASADGGNPSHPYGPSPEAQPVLRCSAESENFIAWQSEGLTHVSRKTPGFVGGAYLIAGIQHYDRETPFRAEFQGVTVIVSDELDVCVPY